MTKYNDDGDPIYCACGGRIKRIEDCDGVSHTYEWNGAVYEETDVNTYGTTTVTYECQECGEEHLHRED